MKNSMKALFGLLCLVMTTQLTAENTFMSGPLIQNYGAHAPVEQDMPLDPTTTFKIAFDVGQQNADGGVNRSFDSLARFLNMHVANGVKPKNIKLALVIHGKAAFDTLNKAGFESRFLKANPNQALLSELMKNNVDIYVCGQTAGFLSIKRDELQKGITMSLSAMTAHALLQKEGYTLNPF